MNYQEFQSYIKNELAGKLPEDYQLTIQPVTKNNNIVLDSLTILSPDQNITPSIYLNPYYHRYLNGVALEEIIEDILFIYHEYSPKETMEIDALWDYAEAKKHVVVKLINSDRNLEILSDCPHVPFMDLSIVFVLLLYDERLGGNGSILVHNSMLDEWKVDLDTLYKDAIFNATGQLPPRFEPLSTAIADSMSQLAGTEDTFMKGSSCHGFDDRDEMDRDLDLLENNPMYILTNSRKWLGASALIYPRLLKKIGEEFASNLMLLPSSIHEFIIIPTRDCDEDMDLSYFSQMVTSINETELEDEEVLSNNAYLYNYKTGILSNGIQCQTII